MKYVRPKGVDSDNISYRNEIEYVEVLKHIKSKDLVIIEGRPGSGKTALVHKITQDWANAPSIANRLILLVSLRAFNNFKKPGRHSEPV
jgi:ABC-type lipoprotein export system ATPase subunit